MKINIYFALLVILICYLLIPLNIQTWESYHYSNVIDGLQDIRDVFIFQNPNIKELFSNFSGLNIFHPNHPLSHLMVRFTSVLMPFLSSVKISQILNSIYGVIGSLYFYRILKLLDFKNIEAVLGGLILCFGATYWYQALSGEVYSLPITLSIIVFYFSISDIKNNFNPTPKKRTLFFIFLANISHLLTGLYLPAIIYLFYSKNDSVIFNFKKRILPILISVLLGGILFYLAPHLIYSQRKGSIFNMLFSYGHFLGFWSQSYSSISLGQQIAISVSQISNLFFFPKNVFYKAANYTLIASILILFFKNFSLKNKMENAFAISILCFYFAITFIIALPNVNDYWIFAYPYLIYILLVGLKEFFISRVILIFISILLFSSNFAFEIYPQSKLSENFHWVAENIKLTQGSTVVTLNSRPFSHSFEKQAWHLARISNVQNPILISDIQNTDQITKLKNILESNFYIFTDMTADELTKFLDKINYTVKKISLIKQFDVIDEEQLQTTAINTHSKLKNWKMNQFLIERI